MALASNETRYEVLSSDDLQHLLACPREGDPERPLYFDFHDGAIDLYGPMHGADVQRRFHYVHGYPGRIHPWIPMYLLGMDAMSCVPGPVIDPFSGTGTIPLESLINPVHPKSALAMEINPLAALITRVKTHPIRFQPVEELIARVQNEYYGEHSSDDAIENSRLVTFWYSGKAISQLSRLKTAIENCTDLGTGAQDFLRLAFYSVCRNSSRADPRIAPPVVLKKRNYSQSKESLRKVSAQLNRMKDPPVFSMFESAVKTNYNRLYALSAHEPFWTKGVDAETLVGDCCTILRDRFDAGEHAGFGNGSSDKAHLFVTSPPYLTAQKYIRSSKLQLAWMGYSEEQIREFDRHSIGTEYSVFRTEQVLPLLPTSVSSLVERTAARSEERARSVQNYFEGMFRFFSAVHDSLANDGILVLITGDNSVCGESVATHTLLADCAESVGLRQVLTVANNIKNYSMMTCRNRTSGVIRTEYVTWFGRP
jgi:hypothetical protein